ncbi:helix-turn-helix domain-containing protein [Dysgonomonas capnocytophagoides]|uniref:Helix-turn-helix domain-containing protein n=1 Tax=Dysgonomonas capnocytophagoides TaxID=45254 RepID=A0A4Y8L1G9_9BACT|nr:GyrI-like domain-containing protein [Dysgonomonas capnocytophagoides]TFD96423.1 helix-turn-helix domain-containing protein [Dysgonomonas capnocytophagoides]
MMNTDIRYCQSCGIPLRFDIEGYLGTNADKSRSDNFCRYCLKDGEYVDNIPMEEMVDIWIKYIDEYNECSGTNYTSEELRLILKKRLPTLKRWQQKETTSNIHYRSIQKITAYINSHLFDELNMDILISMGGLSKYHFRRIFKSITGENISSYIQRLRIEQIAHLLISTNYTLEQIIHQTVYQSKFSLSKAFKKHFGISTSEYRKKYKQGRERSDVNLNPEIKRLNNIYLICLEVGDTYRNRNKYKFKWSRLSQYAQQNKLSGSYYGRSVSISLDDPLITPLSQCRFYLGITVWEGIEPMRRSISMKIPNGNYAIFRHKGSYASLHKLYKAIYEEWLPHSKYRMKSTLSFEIYLNDPKTTKASELVTEVYFPIENKIK